MSSSTGRGRFYKVRHLSGLRGRVGLPDVTVPARTIATDTFWGGGPPTPVDIPYAWLSPPARFRPDPARNVGTITRSGGSPVRVVARASVAAIGERPYTAQLDSAVIDDPFNLATWIVGNYTTPRQRNPRLALNLIDRTAVECWRLLELDIGARIRISNAPGSDQQLVSNPWFDANLTGWTPTGCVVTQSSTWSRSGGFSMLLTPDGVTATVFAEDDRRRVIPGATYVVDGWLFSPGGYAAVGLSVNWYDAAGGFLSTSSTTSAIGAAFTSHRTHSYVAPAGAYTGRVCPALTGTPAGSNTLFVDELTMTGPDGTVPPWPAGVTDLVVEGVSHVITGDERWLFWNTAPIVGTVPGRAGPWFRADESITDTGDRLAF